MPDDLRRAQGDTSHDQHPHPCQRAYAKLRERALGALTKPTLGRIWRRALLLALIPLAIIDYAARWLAGLGDLLIRWWIGFVRSLRSERGYLTAGSIVAVYFAIFGLFDSKATQEETRASVERSVFMSMVTAGNGPSFVAAMKTFGPVQTMEATAHPDPLRFWVWGGTSRPNLAPMWNWAVSRLGNCGPNDCSMESRDRLDLTSADLSYADLSTIHRVGDIINANGFSLNLSEPDKLNLLDLSGGDNSFRLTCDLNHANLSNADLSHANLIGANLNNANLIGANLSDAVLILAKVVDAKLHNATLSNTDLRDADLTHADLSGANLIGADLTGADLGHANLSGANLNGAELTGADLSHADLSGAKPTQAQLDGACGADVVLPEGFHAPRPCRPTGPLVPPPSPLSRPPTQTSP